MPKFMELCPSPSHVLLMSTTTANVPGPKRNEAMANWSYEHCCNHWTEIFRNHCRSGCTKLNAKCLVDAAILSVATNNGKMVRDPTAIMSITNMGYKKMAIMLHGTDDVKNYPPAYIGCDLHMHRVMSALRHMAKRGNNRHHQLESYLPKELWGLINDKLCSLCQLLDRSKKSAALANKILEDIVGSESDERRKKKFESFRKIILNAYNRSELE